MSCLGWLLSEAEGFLRGTSELTGGVEIGRVSAKFL